MLQLENDDHNGDEEEGNNRAGSSDYPLTRRRLGNVDDDDTTMDEVNERGQDGDIATRIRSTIARLKRRTGVS
jgi:hypothetical protein